MNTEVLRNRRYVLALAGEWRSKRSTCTDRLQLRVFWHMSLAYAMEVPVSESEPRHVRLFRNGRNQAVRIPVEFELPGDEAIMHREGDRLVIEPVRKRGLVALLKTMKPLEEAFPEIDDPVPARENVF